MYAEDDFVQLSALQHFLFCPRQCALIHIEQTWFENQLTAEGRIMHENVDEQKKGETRGGIKIERGLLIRSFALGLSGKADVVEFHRQGVSWIPFPVEYKRGKPKEDFSDRVQLCAQALCLEEMMGIPVSCGALFYGRTRRRLDVQFDDSLRWETQQTASCLHAFMEEHKTPEPIYDRKCDSCSLLDVCMPKATGGRISVGKYLQEGIAEHEEIS